MVRSLLTIGNALFSPIFPSYSLIYESGSDNPFQRYGHSKFSKMAAGRHLGFGVTGNRSIQSAVPEKPYPRIKYKVDRMIRYRDTAIKFELNTPRYSRPTRRSCVQWASTLPFRSMYGWNPEFHAVITDVIRSGSISLRIA